MGGRYVDMNQHVGKTYNYLTILSLEFDYYNYKDKLIKRTFFNCQCECGNIKKILSGAVIKGTTKSCGCKKKELVLTAIEKYHEEQGHLPVENKMFGSYKKHGKKFNLTLDEFSQLTYQNCYYCGGNPEKERFSKSKTKSKFLNGIDRIDSSIGYELDNCVPCCTTCNIMKNTLSNNVFLNHIQKITNFQINKNEKIIINNATIM